MKFYPCHSPRLRDRLLGAFIVTRNHSSRTLSTLLAADAILATRLPREWLAGGTFSDCSVLSCQLYALLAPLHPPYRSASFRLFGDLLDYPTSSWSPALSLMLSTRSSVPLHQFGVHLTVRHPHGHSSLPGYSASSWLLGVLWRPPSHSAISCLP